MTKFPYEPIDLTHTLDENTPTWNGGCGFTQAIKSDYSGSLTEVSFRVQQLKLHAGLGTHLDAPAHCIPGGMTIDALPLTNLLAPCVVIDVSAHAHERYRVTLADVKTYENTFGLMEAGSFVMFRTGWERFWHDPEQYRNQHCFPSVSREVAALLLERGVVGIGIDTLSPDRPEDGFPVHTLLLGAGKYIVENAANVAQLPPHGSFILALPIKTRGGTEAPIRLVGLKQIA